MIRHRIHIRPLDSLADMDRYRVGEKPPHRSGLKSLSRRHDLSSTGDHPMRRRIVLLIIAPMVDVLGLMVDVRKQTVAFIPRLAVIERLIMRKGLRRNEDMNLPVHV